MTMLSLVPNRSRLKTGCAATATAACWFLCLSPENHGNSHGSSQAKPIRPKKNRLVWLKPMGDDAWLVVALCGDVFWDTSGVTKL